MSAVPRSPHPTGPGIAFASVAARPRRFATVALLSLVLVTGSLALGSSTTGEAPPTWQHATTYGPLEYVVAASGGPVTPVVPSSYVPGPGDELAVIDAAAEAANEDRVREAVERRARAQAAEQAAAAEQARRDVWDRLARCESSGRWSLASGNGYYGGLQFAQATWTGHGGTAYAPRADLATREQQIAIAEKVLRTQGWRAWPACSRRLGLR